MGDETAQTGSAACGIYNTTHFIQFCVLCEVYTCTPVQAIRCSGILMRFITTLSWAAVAMRWDLDKGPKVRKVAGRGKLTNVTHEFGFI